MNDCPMKDIVGGHSLALPRARIVGRLDVPLGGFSRLLADLLDWSRTAGAVRGVASSLEGTVCRGSALGAGAYAPRNVIG